jgi:hypothetical protein
MNFQSDLFSINNITIPISDKLIHNNNNRKFEKIKPNYIIYEQKKFESIDVLSFKPKNLDESNIDKELKRLYNKRRDSKKYKQGESFKKLKTKKWYNFAFDLVKSSIRSKNNRIKRMYEKKLKKYQIDIENGFLDETPPENPDYYNKPNFSKEFIIKLYEIQDGLDIYTNQKMIISSERNPFSPSCDRIDNNKDYEIGNVVLCCYSTNQSKNTFDPFIDTDSSWLYYISGGDAIKKKQILERMQKIQTLFME